MSAGVVAERRAVWQLDAAMVGAGLAGIAVTLLGSHAWTSDPGELLTRNTVRLSLAWYAAALVLMMSLGPRDWAAETPRGRLARWCWTWAILSFIVHLGVAFHFYHHWSHTHAFEHTREVSGTGEGIYVSYLFTWLWIGDAAWWWAAPAAYAARGRWIDRLLHSFMLFIVFNGMVIFESGPIRWVGLVMFVMLGVAWLRARPT